MKYLIIVRRRKWPDRTGGPRGGACSPVVFNTTATPTWKPHARSKTWSKLFTLPWAAIVLRDCDGNRRNALRRLAYRYGCRCESSAYRYGFRCESATLRLDD